MQFETVALDWRIFKEPLPKTTLAPPLGIPNARCLHHWSCRQNFRPSWYPIGRFNQNSAGALMSSQNDHCVPLAALCSSGCRKQSRNIVPELWLPEIGPPPLVDHSREKISSRSHPMKLIVVFWVKISENSDLRFCLQVRCSVLFFKNWRSFWSAIFTWCCD